MENSLPGTSVLGVVVVGVASDSKFVYRTSGQTGSRYEWFQVDSASGQIVTSSTFSCLTVGEYTFEVTATGTNPASQQLVLTAAVVVMVTPISSSQRSFFSQPFYFTTIANNTQLGTCVLKVCIK